MEQYRGSRSLFLAPMNKYRRGKLPGEVGHSWTIPHCTFSAPPVQKSRAQGERNSSERIETLFDDVILSFLF